VQGEQSIVGKSHGNHKASEEQAFFMEMVGVGELNGLEEEREKDREQRERDRDRDIDRDGDGDGDGGRQEEEEKKKWSHSKHTPNHR
jgi:hypothetical protein